MASDGTDALCLVLYGETRPEYFLGGSGARMLTDAADEIARLRAALAEAERTIHERDLLIERWECESHPWQDAAGDPITDYVSLRANTCPDLSLVERRCRNYPTEDWPNYA